MKIVDSSMGIESPRFRRTSPNQIAAGEVVERPASVRRRSSSRTPSTPARAACTIHVELGGKKQVRVEDDGEGWSRDDARLAIERHATSKIRRADDLGAISTLGFRGEALPSIASVSHFVLRTRARGRSSGTEIRVNGGADRVGRRGRRRRRAPSIEVDDLFYNLPARRKFLKSDGGGIGAGLARLARSWRWRIPRSGFTLTSERRARVPQCAAAPSTLRDRLYQVTRDRVDLIEVQRRPADPRLHRLHRRARRTGADARAAERLRQPPHREGPDDRARDHRVLQRARRSRSAARRSTCSSRCRPTRVDVNVHPTKAEVRFREQSLVHEVRAARAHATRSGRAARCSCSCGAETCYADRGRRRGRFRHAAGESIPSRWHADAVATSRTHRARLTAAGFAASGFSRPTG